MKRILAVGIAVAAAVAASPPDGAAQTVFRSTQSANLPTAAMLDGGNWMFEISHRFGPVSGGADDLWGIDGPVLNRLGLTYAPHDRVMLGVLRSNGFDNVELNAKARALTIDSESLPIEVAVMAGVAWNTAVSATPAVPGLSDNEMQAYATLIANALVADRLALGVSPAVLRNPRLEDVDAETAFVAAVNGQLYFNRTWSFFGEWIFSEARTDLPGDSGTFGFEIRTRGHFFKLLLTNQQRMNPTQFLAGSIAGFSDTDEWRFGFNLTRLLPF